MKSTLIYPVGTTDACQHAADILQQRGFPMTDHPRPEITHLLLDVPGFLPDGSLRCGLDLHYLLSMLPESISIIGGNLTNPILAYYHCIDLLQDADYLAQNAAITADCALRIAAQYLKTAFFDTHSLILGWGRIGKCLARRLKALGCPVTIAARSSHDRALIRTFGYNAVDFSDLPTTFSEFHLLFNTVPAPILDPQDLSCSPDCVIIELASSDGICHPDVIIARGLPGTYAPVSSGKLIADTFFRLWKEDSICM